MPDFQLRGYNPETAIAEKFQAMVFLGGINDRLKDFYDIYLLSQECAFDGESLVQAIIATFKNRNTAIPFDIPTALSDEFALLKQMDWFRFLNRVHTGESQVVSFPQVIEALREFLLPPSRAAAKGEKFTLQWRSGRGWR